MILVTKLGGLKRITFDVVGIIKISMTYLVFGEFGVPENTLLVLQAIDLSHFDLDQDLHHRMEFHRTVHHEPLHRLDHH